MAKFYTQLDEKLKKFILEQKIYFTGTAPVDGRINVSPKGMDSFRILSDTKVGFLSVTGSGNETAAHLKENGRITIMFCSFTTQPWILRIYGKGICIYPTDDLWDEVVQDFEVISGTRQIFVIDIESVQTSCGYSIPFYEYQSERDTLIKWADQKGEDVLKKYQIDNNIKSIDGLDTGLKDE